METKDFKNTNGITLISLVVSIIVILILAGVSIITLTGDNGIVGRAVKSKEVHKIAEIEEKANLVYSDLLIGGHTEEPASHTVDFGAVLAKLVADGDITSATPTSGSRSITGLTFSPNAVDFGVGDSEIITVTPTYSDGSGDYEVVIEGQTYLAHMENNKITIDKEPIGEGGPNFEISNPTSSDASVSAEKTGTNKVTVTANSTGSSTVTVSCGSVSETFSVTVSTKYTVNLYASSSAENATTIKVVEGTKASEATGYALPTPPEGQVFDKWLLKTAVTGYVVGSDATELLNGNNGVTQNLDVYATYKKAPEFGEADLTLKEYFGKEVLTKGTTNVEITLGTVTAKWQLFYADSEKIYLIYPDYLENGQIPTGTNILTNACRVQASGRRSYLIDYLSNTSNWTNVSNEFNTKFNMTEITAKGAPSVDMWIASYNAKYGITLGTKNFTTTGETYYLGDSGTSTSVASNPSSTGTSGTGYLYTRDSTANPIKYENYLRNDYIETTGGYPTSSSNMYWPHTSVYSLSYGYWLCSPSAESKDYVCCVDCSGKVGYNIYTAYYGVRPLVSIPRSKVNIYIDTTGTDTELSLIKIVQ